jgi:dihydrofolate synthase/folylpolyglutamate synthase
MLDQFFELTNEFKSIDLTLKRIYKALNDANIDVSKLGQVIHVAGTNGKGSTSFFIAQMLDNLGYKTALFTSPHIENITERIKLGIVDISEEYFSRSFNSLKNLISLNKLTFFEALTLIAFDIFTEYRPDFTILETGMGGRFDATNVIDHKLPIITSISQDHSGFLGKNIFQIADEKLAIIKDNPIFFVGKNPLFILNYIHDKFKDKKIISVQYDNEAPYPKPYSYNFNLAKEVVRFITDKNVVDNKYCLPPCRMERIGRFILDGSHNPAGLLNTITNFDADTVIFSCTYDRPIEKMLNILKRSFKNIIITKIPENSRSLDIDLIPDTKGIFKIQSPEDAVNKSIYISGKSDIIIIGSLYLCGYLRKYIKGLCV